VSSQCHRRVELLEPPIIGPSGKAPFWGRTPDHPHPPIASVRFSRYDNDSRIPRTGGKAGEVSDGSHSGVDPLQTSSWRPRCKMARHYLATRKPRRLERIRKLFQQADEFGINLRFWFISYEGKAKPLDTCRWPRVLDNFGYMALTNLERELREAIDHHNTAKAEAVAAVAFLAGNLHLNCAELIESAEGVAPLRAPYAAQPFQRAEWYLKAPVDPFHALTTPSFLARPASIWARLFELSFRELQVLHLQLENQVLRRRVARPVEVKTKNDSGA
jgi:hypothetical protein